MYVVSYHVSSKKAFVTDVLPTTGIWCKLGCEIGSSFEKLLNKIEIIRSKVCTDLDLTAFKNLRIIDLKIFDENTVIPYFLVYNKSFRIRILRFDKQEEYYVSKILSKNNVIWEKIYFTDSMCRPKYAGCQNSDFETCYWDDSGYTCKQCREYYCIYGSYPKYADERYPIRERKKIGYNLNIILPKNYKVLPLVKAAKPKLSC